MIDNKNNLKIKLFTHNDLDGVSVIPLAQLEFGKENVDYEICSYKNVNEKLLDFLTKYMVSEYIYDYIFITDISVSKENAELLNEIENSISGNSIKITNVRLFDHHQNLEWLNDGYQWAKVKPENEDKTKNCGTSLFFDFIKETSVYSFVEKEYIESFVNQVRIYDTWEWKDNKELNKEMAASAKKLADCFKIVGADDFIDTIYYQLLKESLDEEYKFFEIIIEWELLLKYKRREIDEYISRAKNKFQIVEFDDDKCAFLICDRIDCTSELGNIILEENKEIDFVAMFYSFGIALRSRKDKYNVANLASKYSGGGHQASAGFIVSSDILEKIQLFCFDGN